MQAVMALCNFCENDGPRVVVTCQPMRELPVTYADSVASTSRETLQSVTPSVSPTPSSTSLSSPRRVKVNMERRPVVSEGSELPTFYGDCTRSVVDIESRCRACTSFGNGPCLLSNDHENRTTYVTSQIALKENIHERIKQACLRSLSCEITSKPYDKSMPPPSSIAPPRKGGGVWISNDSRSRDEEVFASKVAQIALAEGQMVFGDASIGYCISFQFQLCDAKSRGCQRLFSILILSVDMPYILSNYDFFVNAMVFMKNRLQELSLAVFEKERMQHVDMNPMRPELASVASRVHKGFFQEMKMQPTIDTNRSLQTITDSDNIFYILHRQMMWTLRTQTLRYSDRVMEGLPTQDMLVMREMDQSEVTEFNTEHPEAQKLQRLRNLRHIARQVAAGGRADLELLLKTIVEGTTVVVECVESWMGTAVIGAMTPLLPVGCLRANPHADVYEPHRYRVQCFTGFGTEMGDMDDSVLVLRIKDQHENRIRRTNSEFAMGSDSPASLGCNSIGDTMSSLEDYTVQVVRRPLSSGPKAPPTVVRRYIDLLLDEELMESVLDATLRTSREHWLSRSKLFYELSEQRRRDPQMQGLDDTYLLKLAHNSMIQDRGVLEFWQSGLSKAYRRHVAEAIDEVTADGFA